jgi:hypothetical protein
MLSVKGNKNDETKSVVEESFHQATVDKRSFVSLSTAA